MPTRTGVDEATISFTVTFEMITCCNCGLAFGVPGDWQSARRRDHQTFYCPNGHPQSYQGETREERLERELRAAQARATHAEDQRAAAERAASAARGQVTRMKNRAANGVCQCCNRSFANLHRHMTTKHPEFAVKD